MHPQVITVEAINNRQLLVTFSNQERRLFDVSEYLEFPVFQVLRDSPDFYNVRVAHGTVAWLNDIDLCADTVYLKSTPI